MDLGVVTTTIPSSSAPIPEKSADLIALLQHQTQIKDWSQKVNKRIFELEEQYLEETTLGNIIRGWDQDAKPINKKAFIEDKERLFSNSSISSQLTNSRGNLHARHSGSGYGSMKVKKKRGY